MKTSDIILAGAAAIGLFLAYSVGHKQGLKAAPEYVEMKERARAEMNAEMAAWEAQYEGSQDQVCDRIFDLVEERRMLDIRYDREPDPSR